MNQNKEKLKKKVKGFLERLHKEFTHGTEDPRIPNNVTGIDRLKYREVLNENDHWKSIGKNTIPEESIMDWIKYRDEKYKKQAFSFNPKDFKNIFNKERFKEEVKNSFLKKSKLQSGGTISSNNKNKLERFNDNLYGNWNSKKPQLFKDFPILDPISPTLQYITGNTPKSTMNAGVPMFGGFKGWKWKGKWIDLKNPSKLKKGGFRTISENISKNKNYPKTKTLWYTEGRTYPENVLNADYLKSSTGGHTFNKLVRSPSKSVSKEYLNKWKYKKTSFSDDNYLKWLTDAYYN